MDKITHHSFTLDRHYPHPTARVFGAFTDPAARLRWFFMSDAWTLHALGAPPKVEAQATERSRFSPPGSSAVLTNDTTYCFVQPGRRLIFTYAMTINGAPLSASLCTVDFQTADGGTRLEFTEQGAYFDGFAKGRAEGTQHMLLRFGQELDSGTI